jgi:hypothetical protein
VKIIPKNKKYTRVSHHHQVLMIKKPDIGKNKSEFLDIAIYDRTVQQRCVTNGVRVNTSRTRDNVSKHITTSAIL